MLAVTSAGVVHAVTRSCSAGNLPDCGCRMPSASAATTAPLSEEEDVDEPLVDIKTAQQVLTNNPSGARNHAAGSTSDQDGERNDVNANVGE